jgi:hypothetical protein
MDILTHPVVEKGAGLFNAHLRSPLSLSGIL